MKKQSMKQRMRLISALLALILCLLSCPLYAAAEVGESTGDVILPSSTGSGLSSPVEDANALTWTPNDLFLLEAGDKPLSELAEMTLDASSLPEGLSYEQAVASGHVNRVREQEPDLNTVTFQNTNGTKTAYVYTKPVKYIDEMGVVRDKSSAITQQANGGYAMLDNSVKAYFPKNISAGVCIEYEDYSVTMRPITTGMLVPTQSYTEGRVVYANVFGAATLLSYQTTLDGIKEDIILVKNTGQNEFSFMLTLDGVTPVCVDGVWYVKNAENRIIGSFGEVVVKDSAGKTVKGSMTVAQANNASTYTLTVTVPEEYLQAADTQYPVYVDPTVNIFESEMYQIWDENGNDTIGYYDAIVDIGMNTNLGDSFELRPNNSSGVIYLLHDFYGQYAKYADMPYYQIGNVKMHLTKKSGADVDLAAFVIYDWMDGLAGTDSAGEPVDESLTYNEMSQDYYCILFPQLFDLNNPDGAGELTDEGGWVDITYIAKEWVQCDPEAGGANPARGLVLFANSTTDSATIYSTEATGNSKVYYTIDYSTNTGEKYIYNDATGRFVSIVTENTGALTIKATYDDGISSKWFFEYNGNNQYIIRSVAKPNYVLCASSNGSMLICDYLSNDTGDGKFYWVVGYHIEIGSYLINSYSKNCDCPYCPYFQCVHADCDCLKCVCPECSVGCDCSECETSCDCETCSSNYNCAKCACPKRILSFLFEGIDSLSLYEFELSSGFSMSVTIFSTSVYVPMNSFSVCDDFWVDEDVESTRTLVPDIIPNNATLKQNRYFNWESSNSNVVSVDKYGVVTFLSEGFAVITVTYPYTQQTCKIGITVGQALSNGVYYMENHGTSKYLTVEGQSTESGANIEIQDFSTDGYERWNLTYVGSGYYQIQSQHSSKYLSVSNVSTDSGMAIQQTSSLSPDMWKILQTKSGATRIIPYSGENAGTCLAIPSTLDSAGTNCVQIPYIDDLVANDEWGMYKVNYTSTVNNYYDEGYLVRYSESHATARNNIKMYNLAVAERYLQLVGLELKINEPQYFRSGLDQCKLNVTSDNIDTLCSHWPECHTDYTSVHSNLKSEDMGNSKRTSILWTGHKVKCEFTSGNIDYNRSFSYEHCVYMLEICTESNRTFNSISVLMHELNHQYGVRDHYHDVINGECRNKDICSKCPHNPRNASCIMNHSRIDINLPTVLCIACKNEMLVHLNSHHVYVGG